MIFLYKLSNIYAAFLKLLGYERGLSRFLDRLDLEFPRGARILDVACGSGIVGLRLMRRCALSTLLATDLQENFLKETRLNARDQGIEDARLTVAQSDLSEPRKVTHPDGRVQLLESGSFDIVSVGGALGYAKDVEQSTRELLALVRPGGYFINLEMNSGIMGRFVAWLYSYRPLPVEAMRRIAAEGGHDVKLVRFSVSEFPANLTRIGIVVRVKDTAIG